MKRTPPESFEAMYREHADPWSFGTRWYEQRRYDLIAAILPDRTYRRALEPGASIGELSARLAPRCAHLDTMDVSPTAVAAAIGRLEGVDNVTVRVGSFPEDIPDALYDLVVLSELGYYFDEDALDGVLRALKGHCAPEVTLVGCHWLGESDDHQLGGDEVHSIMEASWGTPRCTMRDPGFRCDVWVRR